MRLSSPPPRLTFLAILITTLASLISAHPNPYPDPLPFPSPQENAASLTLPPSAQANLTNPDAGKLPACLPPSNTPLLTDCMLALALLPSSPLIRSFTRSQKITTEPYELPKAYEVGTCLISISFPSGNDRDESSWVEIGNLAHRMAMGCLKASIEGGTEVRMTTAGTARLGKFGFVSVKMWEAAKGGKGEEGVVKGVEEMVGSVEAMRE